MRLFRNILVVLGGILLAIILAIIVLFIVSAFDDYRSKKLKKAIESNDVAFVVKNIDKYKKDEINYSQLFQSKNNEVLAVFIDNDLVPNTIIESCYQHDEDIISLFVSKYGYTDEMYKYILSNLNIDKLEMFLKSNPGKSNEDILFDASETGNYYIIRYLVESKKVSINIMDQNKMTPLFYLVNSYDKHGDTLFDDRRMESFLYLVDKGMSIYHKDSEGRSLLSYAYCTNIMFIKYLLDSGLNINDKDAQGNTVMHYIYSNTAEGFYYNYSIAQYLISRGADLNIKNKDGKSPSDLLKEIESM